MCYTPPIIKNFIFVSDYIAKITYISINFYVCVMFRLNNKESASWRSRWLTWKIHLVWFLYVYLFNWYISVIYYVDLHFLLKTVTKFDPIWFKFKVISFEFQALSKPDSIYIIHIKFDPNRKFEKIILCVIYYWSLEFQLLDSEFWFVSIPFLPQI